MDTHHSRWLPVPNPSLSRSNEHNHSTIPASLLLYSHHYHTVSLSTGLKVAFTSPQTSEHSVVLPCFPAVIKTVCHSHITIVLVQPIVDKPEEGKLKDMPLLWGTVYR